jgi:hypothetical protein
VTGVQTCALPISGINFSTWPTVTRGSQAHLRVGLFLITFRAHAQGVYKCRENAGPNPSTELCIIARSAVGQMGDLFSTILWVSAVVIAISGAVRIVNYLKTISTRATQISDQLSHIELKLGQLDHLEKLDLFDQRGEKLDLLDQQGEKLDLLGQTRREIISQLASIEKRVGEVVSQLEVSQSLLLEQLQSIGKQLELLEKANAPDDDDWPIKD